MEREIIFREVRQLPFGKRLPDAKYFHQDGLPLTSPLLREFLSTLLDRFDLRSFSFNLLKFSHVGFRLSLLNYPSFWRDDFPALNESCSIDLESGNYRISSYKESQNPPILHRKETFLPEDHSRYKEFARVTRMAEDAGLFEGCPRMGFRNDWLEHIQGFGYTIRNGLLTLLEEPGERSIVDTQVVQRHRTAIDRYSLSSPVQALFQHQFLDGSPSFFDYGCGKGDDVRELQSKGLPASGWDPHFFPDNAIEPAEVVNLGFVINVIEDQEERAETLRRAFSLSRRVLSVSAMLSSEIFLRQFRSYRDGIITKRNTFQKFFTQEEMKRFIENTLQKNAIAVRPGVFFVFQSEDEEQEFLEKRQRRSPLRAYQVTKPRRQPTAKVRRGRVPRHRKIEENLQLVEQFREACFTHGRLCGADEFAELDKIRAIFGSGPRAFEYIMERTDPGDWEKARQTRREDLLVYLSLGLFGRRKAYSHHPKSLQRDIKHLFGGYPEAQEEAKALLFSVSDKAQIENACIQATQQEFGYLFGSHSLQLHTSLISQLPPILRVYVGCATQLFGDVEKADLIKIHIQSKKVSLMKYERFWESSVPKLLERIKINLLEQKIDFFDYKDREQAQILYLKSRYLHRSCPGYDEQKAFDEKIAAMNVFDFSGFGPPAAVFYSTLQQHGVDICDQVDY